MVYGHHISEGEEQAFIELIQKAFLLAENLHKPLGVLANIHPSASFSLQCLKPPISFFVSFDQGSMLALVFVLILNTAGVLFDQLSGQFNQNGNFIRNGPNARFKFREIAHGVNAQLAGGKRFFLDFYPLIEGVHEGFFQFFLSQMRCFAAVVLFILVVALPDEGAIYVVRVPELPTIKAAAVSANYSGRKKMR